MQELRANREEARSIVLKYPQVLNLSVDKNLRRKLDFFKRELRGSEKEIRDAIIGSPTLLGYSLTNRLHRRVKVLRSAGVNPSFSDVWLVSSYTGLRFNRVVEKIVMSNIGVSVRGNKEVERTMQKYRDVLRGR